MPTLCVATQRCPMRTYNTDARTYDTTLSAHSLRRHSALSIAFCMVVPACTTNQNQGWAALAVCADLLMLQLRSCSDLLIPAGVRETVGVREPVRAGASASAIAMLAHCLQTGGILDRLPRLLCWAVAPGNCLQKMTQRPLQQNCWSTSKWFNYQQCAPDATQRPKSHRRSSRLVSNPSGALVIGSGHVNVPHCTATAIIATAATAVKTDNISRDRGESDVC